jgi:hypothetical protein
MVKRNNLIIVGCLLVCGSVRANTATTQLSGPLQKELWDMWGKNMQQLSEKSPSPELLSKLHEKIVEDCFWGSSDAQDLQELCRAIRVMKDAQFNTGLWNQLASMEQSAGDLHSAYDKKATGGFDKKLKDFKAQSDNAKNLCKVCNGFAERAKELYPDKTTETRVNNFCAKLEGYQEQRETAYKAACRKAYRSHLKQ